MSDKSKAQLIREVEHLRRQVAELREQEARERQAHQAWQESERRLRAERDRAQQYLDIAGVMIVTLDTAGNVTLINRKGAQVLGYPEEEILGKKWVDHFVPPRLRAEVQAIFDRLMAGQIEPVEYYENPCLTRDGEERLIAWHNTIITDAGGHIVGSLSSGEDTTERLQAEQALERNEATLHSVLRAAPIGIGLIWPGRILGWTNERLSQILGYAAEEMQGQSARMLYPSQEVFEWVGREKYAQIGATGTGSVETRWQRKDGRIIDVLLRSTVVNPDDAAAGLVFTALDITEAKTAQSQRDAVLDALKGSEEALRRRNRELTMLNQIIAASASGLEMEAVLETACRELALTFGVPGTIAVLHDEKQTRAMVVAEHRDESWPPALSMTVPIEGNPLLQHLIAHKSPLIVGDAQEQASSPVPLLDLRQRGITALLMLPLLVEGKVVGSLCLGAAESRRFSAEEISLAWNVAGQVAGVLAQARLNQQQRQLEAQYHQAQKMEAVGRLTAGIAHEFNNLLTAINGYAELVHLQLMPGDPLRDMVERVLHSGRRAAGLVRQLLAFSRHQVIEPLVVSLNGVVSEMGRMLQRIIGEDVELVTVLAPDVWPVRVDPAQIEQVIVNLAINARDAMPSGGRLSIETANVTLDESYAAGHLEVQPGDYVLLTVSDTGVGMSQQVKAHLFEPFFTTKPTGQGTGLGLATVYGAVKQSGGHIFVYSEENMGATFKIYLPRAYQTIQPAAAARSIADLPFGQETILLVEDDENVRDLARRLLRGQGYTVLEARNGQEALLVSAHHPGPIHLLLTDVVLPGLSGKALAEQLAPTRPQIKVLLTSGYTDDTITHHGVLGPGVAFLQKPFSPLTLALRVRQALDQT